MGGAFNQMFIVLGMYNFGLPLSSEANVCTKSAQWELFYHVLKFKTQFETCQDQKRGP